MEYTTMILQFVMSLSLLVVLHELGHFLPARWFKTRVEKFYLFFDPWFSLVKKKIGDTEYGIGWLPLGGYVKIAGMVDESLDTEQLQGPPQPWEFRSKPAWQRLIIMLGGVIVNFLLGFFLFAMILWWWGETYLPASQVAEGIYVEEIGREMGLEDGDHILSINGEEWKEFDSRKLTMAIVLGEGDTDVQVMRNGQKKHIVIPSTYAKKLASREYAQKPIFGPRQIAQVKEVSQGTPAEKSGLQKGDRFIAVNGQSTPYLNDFMKAYQPDGAQMLNLGVLRGKDTIQVHLTTNDKGQIGIYWMMIEDLYKTESRRYGFFESLPKGVSMGYDFLANQIVAFGKMFSGEIKASENLGGFGTITKMFSKTWDWQSFWRITAILSIILGFMNLLPIPALDGGHVMFLIYEMVTGRKPSDKFMEISTIVGFVIVMGLVLYANGLDFYRYFSGK